MSRSEEIGLSKKDLELELEIAQNKVRRLSAVNSGASRHDAICVRETAWLRARCLWLRAVDLDNGGSFLDFPPALVDRLIAESAAQWTGPSCCRNAEQVLSMNFCRPHTDSSAKTAPRRRQLVSDSKGGSTGQPNPIYRFT